MAAKPVLSLSDMMAAQLGRETEAGAKASLAPAERDRPDEAAETAPPAKARGGAARTPGVPEIEKVTVYLPKPVYRFIKQTALELDRRPHDLLMQGVDLMLAQHGKSLKDFGR